MADIQHTQNYAHPNGRSHTDFAEGFNMGLRVAALIEALTEHNSDTQTNAAYLVADMLGEAHKYPTTAQFIAATLNAFNGDKANG